MTGVSRRIVLTGAAATTAVTAVGSIDAMQPAEAATSMDLFLGLSSALTGIAVDRTRSQTTARAEIPEGYARRQTGLLRAGAEISGIRATAQTLRPEQ